MKTGSFHISLTLSVLLFSFTIQHFTIPIACASSLASDDDQRNNNILDGDQRNNNILDGDQRSNNILDDDLYQNLLMDRIQSELDQEETDSVNAMYGMQPTMYGMQPTMYGMKAKRRGFCLRRGMSCDNHPDSCCFKSSCRCNLWGANCRCSRIGLLQKLF